MLDVHETDFRPLGGDISLEVDEVVPRGRRGSPAARECSGQGRAQAGGLDEVSLVRALPAPHGAFTVVFRFYHFLAYVSSVERKLIVWSSIR